MYFGGRSEKDIGVGLLEYRLVPLSASDYFRPAAEGQWNPGKSQRLRPDHLIAQVLEAGLRLGA
jgi:hypothetical protein